MQKHIQKAGFSEKLFDAGKVKLNYVEGPSNSYKILLKRLVMLKIEISQIILEHRSYLYKTVT